jgi:hypothetical protein
MLAPSVPLFPAACAAHLNLQLHRGQQPAAQPHAGTHPRLLQRRRQPLLGAGASGIPAGATGRPAWGEELELFVDA